MRVSFTQRNQGWRQTWPNGYCVSHPVLGLTGYNEPYARFLRSGFLHLRF